MHSKPGSKALQSDLKPSSGITVIKLYINGRDVFSSVCPAEICCKKER